MEARSVCAATSPLRQLAFMRINFTDEDKTTTTMDAEGKPVDKVRTAEDILLQELYTNSLDKFSQYYIQYLKFRRLVNTVPLMPDKDALA